MRRRPRKKDKGKKLGPVPSPGLPATCLSIRRDPRFPDKRKKPFLERVLSVGNLGIGPNNVQTTKPLWACAHCSN